MGFRQQILFTLALMPVTFGIWYAAGALLAGPAAWLAGIALTQGLPTLVSDTGLDDTLLVLFTQFGSVDGQLLPAREAGHAVALQINTRLVSYSVPFYAALLWASRVEDAGVKFFRGLGVLWLLMALGLMAVAGKDLMVMLGPRFLEHPGVPPANVIAVGYQFSVLLMPTLAPVLLWLWQLRDSPLWQTLSNRLGEATKPRHSDTQP